MKRGGKKNLITLLQHKPSTPLLEGAYWYHFLGILPEISLFWAQKKSCQMGVFTIVGHNPLIDDQVNFALEIINWS